MSDVALDTSAAVPYVLRSHSAHVTVRQHVSTRRPRLTGHSLVETYSVLTRLPHDARVAPPDAVRLIETNFHDPAFISRATAGKIPAVLAAVDIAGGATYDALVALAAHEAGLALATRDQRAAATYAALHVDTELITGP